MTRERHCRCSAFKTSWAHKGRVTLCRSVLGNFARRKIYFRNIIKRISATRTPNDAKSESKIRASCRQKEQHILAPWQSCFHDPRTPLPSLCLQDAMDLEGPGEFAEKAVSQCLYNQSYNFDVQDVGTAVQAVLQSNNLEDATAAQRQCRQTSPRTPICLFVDINMARAQHTDVCMEFSHSSSSRRRRMVVRKWTDSSPSGFGHIAAPRTAVSNEVIRSILQNVQAHQADPLPQPTQHAVNLDARHLDGHTNTGGSA